MSITKRIKLGVKDVWVGAGPNEYCVFFDRPDRKSLWLPVRAETEEKALITAQWLNSFTGAKMGQFRVVRHTHAARDPLRSR